MVNHRVSYVKDIAGYGQPYLPGQLSYTTKVEPFSGQGTVLSLSFQDPECWFAYIRPSALHITALLTVN